MVVLSYDHQICKLVVCFVSRNTSWTQYHDACKLGGPRIDLPDFLYLHFFFLIYRLSVVTYSNSSPDEVISSKKMPSKPMGPVELFILNSCQRQYVSTSCLTALSFRFA